MKRALVLYAHPEPASFTAAMRDTAVSALQDAGWQVDVSDLYADGFDPVAGRHDFTTVADPERFHYQTEQAHAAAQDGFVPGLAREQGRMLSADMLVVLFPLWWGGMPAILKGWFDRVLAYGVAYEDGRRYDSGLFRGRKGLLGITTGGTPARFSAEGVYGDIGQVMWPVRRCMMEYMGLETPDPFVAYATPRVDAGTRAGFLRDWHARVTAAAAAAGTPHGAAAGPN